MSKSKNFTAAEKHFEKKRIELTREVELYKSKYIETYKELVQVRDEANMYKSENDSLKDWIERLLEYTSLSEEEIKQVCEAEKKKGEVMQAFSTLMNMANIFGY